MSVTLSVGVDRDGAKRGLADIDAQASRTTSSIGIFGSRDQLGDDYLTRAVAAQMGLYGQMAEEAVYRLYGPGEEAQTGAWSLPAIAQDP
jgi:hypothetical protein